MLGAWFPSALWTPAHVPAAAEVPDSDSFHDSLIELGIAAVSAPNLGLLNGTNAIRYGPFELMRSMLTLSTATDSRVVCCVGAGEAYNITPFGYRRAEGLARLEDHFRLYKQLWEADEPFDFDGHIWKAQHAFLGQQRPAKRGRSSGQWAAASS